MLQQFFTSGDLAGSEEGAARCVSEVQLKAEVAAYASKQGLTKLRAAPIVSIDSRRHPANACCNSAQRLSLVLSTFPAANSKKWCLSERRERADCVNERTLDTQQGAPACNMNAFYAFLRGVRCSSCEGTSQARIPLA